jgi:hypothetical protein
MTIPDISTTWHSEKWGGEFSVMTAQLLLGYGIDRQRGVP